MQAQCTTGCPNFGCLIGLRADFTLHMWLAGKLHVSCEGIGGVGGVWIRWGVKQVGCETGGLWNRWGVNWFACLIDAVPGDWCMHLPGVLGYMHACMVGVVCCWLHIGRHAWEAITECECDWFGWIPWEAINLRFGLVGCVDFTWEAVGIVLLMHMIYLGKQLIYMPDLLGRWNLVIVHFAWWRLGGNLHVQCMHVWFVPPWLGRQFAGGGSVSSPSHSQVGGLYLLPLTPRWGVCIFSLPLPGWGSVSSPSHSLVGGLYLLPLTPRWGVCISSPFHSQVGGLYLLPPTPRWGVCIISLPLPGGREISHSQEEGSINVIKPLYGWGWTVHSEFAFFPWLHGIPWILGEALMRVKL